VAGYRWFPFAKGGEYLPYYADLHLVVNWERDGEEIRNFVDPETGKTFSRPQNTDFYFRPGLTWPLRAARFGPVVLPSGSIFSVRGYAILASINDLEVVGGLINSAAFDFLFKMMLGRFGFPEFIIGVLQQLPIPPLNSFQETKLSKIWVDCVNLKRNLDRANETSHVFRLPALLQVEGRTLAERITNWQTNEAETERKLAEYQRQIDEIAFQLYGIEGEDRQSIEQTLCGLLPDEVETEHNEEAMDSERRTTDNGYRKLIFDMLFHAVGCAFGRWDVRLAVGERQLPELPDPFAPLLVCSPGMLTGPDGLPLTEPPPGYPLRIDWDGILVDDPDHPDDIVRHVREVLEVIWKGRADAIEKEAREILGIRELRDYFRKLGKGGFWDDHVKRYSKSRRKAPIYWLLQSSKKNYALWIYYHRFDKDVLFKALINYVEPRIRLEVSRLESLRSQKIAAGDSGKAAKKLDKEIERQEDFLSELQDFWDKLRRAANLHLEPDLNDGVVLNIAPLWELVPWRVAKDFWEELLEEKYEWSSIGKQLRQKGLVK
jgi:hypothetical protein